VRERERERASEHHSGLRASIVRSAREHKDSWGAGSSSTSAAGPSARGLAQVKPDDSTSITDVSHGFTLIFLISRVPGSTNSPFGVDPPLRQCFR